MADSRFRVWEFVIFPAGNSFEETPFDWFSWLVEKCVPFLAILHHPETNETKWHVHVIVSYDGKKSRPQVLADFSHPNVPVVGDKCFIPVRSLVGAEAYLTHSSKPDCIQYSVDDFVLGNGYELHMNHDAVVIHHSEVLMSEVYKHRDDWTFRDVVGFVVNQYPDALNSLQRFAYVINNLLAASGNISKRGIFH